VAKFETSYLHFYQCLIKLTAPLFKLSKLSIKNLLMVKHISLSSGLVMTIPKTHGSLSDIWLIPKIKSKNGNSTKSPNLTSPPIKSSKNNSILVLKRKWQPEIQKHSKMFPIHTKKFTWELMMAKISSKRKILKKIKPRLRQYLINQIWRDW